MFKSPIADLRNATLFYPNNSIIDDNEQPRFSALQKKFQLSKKLQGENEMHTFFTLVVVHTSVD